MTNKDVTIEQFKVLIEFGSNLIQATKLQDYYGVPPKFDWYAPYMRDATSFKIVGDGYEQHPMGFLVKGDVMYGIDPTKDPLKDSVWSKLYAAKEPVKA